MHNNQSGHTTWGHVASLTLWQYPTVNLNAGFLLILITSRLDMLTLGYSSHGLCGDPLGLFRIPTETTQWIVYFEAAWHMLIIAEVGIKGKVYFFEWKIRPNLENELSTLKNILTFWQHYLPTFRSIRGYLKWFKGSEVNKPRLLNATYWPSFDYISEKKPFFLYQLKIKSSNDFVFHFWNW